MTKTRLLTALLIMLLTTTETFANRPLQQDFQFGVISPIGTNGHLSTHTINKVSLNLLGDYSYGNTIFELSGLHNINLELTRGIQLSGLLNYTGNSLRATQISGLINNANRGVVSAQIGGLFNLAANTEGTQISGLFNATKRDVAGAQISGILNISNDVVGTQLAGGVNLTRDIIGAQITGGVNLTKYIIGAQVAGGINVARDVIGSQFAGAFNVTKDMMGFQIAGVANYAHSTTGTQIGGVINIAKNIGGAQIGLINYAKKSDGVSIGLINIITDGGKQEFELSHSEAIDVALSFRLGTDKFYTIFSGGLGNLHTSTPQYSLGFGAGTHIGWNRGWACQVESMTYMLTEDGNFKHYSNGINQLNQVKYLISKQFASRLKVFAGPVFNITLSDYENSKTERLGTSLTDMVMWTKSNGQFRVDAWVGFSTGVRF